MLSIRPVTSRRDLSVFIKTPRLIYRGMPGWEAPLDYERRQLLDPRKAAFFEHAEAQYWTAYRGAQPVGRISAQVDRLAIKAWSENIGCFGCLDAIDDQGVVNSLCAAAAAWLRDRGMTRMRGPFTLSINGESGLQVSGQERGGMVLMPWHPPYLAGLAAAAGLSGVKDLLAFTLPREFRPNPEVMALASGRLPDSFSIRSIDMRNLERDGEIMRRLFNDAWAENWAFVPITEAEMKALLHGFRLFLRPDLVFIAEIGGEPVGFFVALPNLFDLTRGLDGRLLQPAAAKVALQALRTSTFRSMRIALFGVVRRLHVLGAAIAFALLDQIRQKAESTIYTNAQHLEMSWILEDNRPVITLMRVFGISEPSKRYRMFEMAL